MKNSLFLLVHIQKIIVTIIVLIILAIIILRVVCTDRGATVLTHKTVCYHRAIYRVCQIHGIPMELNYLQGILPPKEGEYEFRMLAKAINQIGLKSKKIDVMTLTDKDLPAIAQLQSSKHFTVIAEVNKKAIHFFNESGMYCVLPRKSLSNMWACDAISVLRNDSNSVLPQMELRHGPDGPRLQFKSLVSNIGEISYINERVLHEIPFQNVGGGPLTLHKVVSSCGCDKVLYPKNPIPVGEHGHISIQHSVKEGGPFTSDVDVFSDDILNRHMKLTLVGNVLTRIEMSMKTIDIQHAVAGEQHVSLVGIKAAEMDEALRLELIECSNEWIDVSFIPLNECQFIELDNEAIWHTRYSRIMEVKCNPGYDDVGNHSDIIRIKTNVPGYDDIVINVSINVLSPVRMFPYALTFDLSQYQTSDFVNLVPLGHRIIREVTANLAKPYHGISWEANEVNGLWRLSIHTKGELVDIGLNEKLKLKIRFADHDDMKEVDMVLPLYFLNCPTAIP